MALRVELDRAGCVARFIRYAQIDTQSDPEARCYPSTPKQLDLSRLLVEELHAMGYSGAYLDEFGYVILHVPGRDCLDNSPTVGFLAHVDTAPDASGKNVKPRIITDYQGGDIILNKTENIVLSPDAFPELEDYIGEDLIVTDGTTLLGADDKAGVAAIMEALRYLQVHPELPHAPCSIVFTVDEEVGEGVEHLDLKTVGADFAYTVDGGAIGELQYENFNASSAYVRILGQAAHPGDAKGKLINAIHVAQQFDAAIPIVERAENSEGREGFYHLMHMNGTVAESKLEYILRDFSWERLKAKETHLERLADWLNGEYGEGTVRVQFSDSYRNMRDGIATRMEIVDVARQALIDSDVHPIEAPIRGGTDGARLTEMGLPCPNIFGGGMNFHSVYEYLPVNSLLKASEVVIRILASFSQR